MAIQSRHRWDKLCLRRSPILSEGYPGREAVLALEPDFLIGSKPEAFADTKLGAGADWQEEQDVGVYLLDGSCQAFHEDGQPKSFEPLLKDIQILGDIFHIKGRQQPFCGTV